MRKAKQDCNSINSKSSRPVSITQNYIGLVFKTAETNKNNTTEFRVTKIKHYSS